MAKANVSSRVLSSTSLVTISEISKLHPFGEIWLPKMSINGIPWTVEICKGERGNQSPIAAYFFCEKDEPSGWAHAAISSFELLSYDDDRDSFKRYSIPYVFDTSDTGYGIDDLIKWNNLFSEDKKYVKDESIKMKIEINVEDPNQPNKSSLKLERINVDRDCRCKEKFRLTVENAANLMAVRSTQFKLRNMLLDLTVFKDHTSHIGMFLYCKSDDFTCEMGMLAKLISSKANVNPIQKSGAARLKYAKGLVLRDFASCNELFKPENGFVNNNSIVFEVKIKAGEPESSYPNTVIRRAVLELECSICLSNVINEELSSTPCGHTFCTEYIRKAAEDNGVCPLCKDPVQPDDLRRIFLPIKN